MFQGRKYSLIMVAWFSSYPFTSRIAENSSILTVYCFYAQYRPGGKESSAWSFSAASQCLDRLTSSGCTRVSKLSPRDSNSPNSLSSLLSSLLVGVLTVSLPIMPTMYTWNTGRTSQSQDHPNTLEIYPNKIMKKSYLQMPVASKRFNNFVYIS